MEAHMDSNGIPSGASAPDIRRDPASSPGPQLHEVQVAYDDSPGVIPPEKDRRQGGGLAAIPEHLR
jgi:hypothetical protein